MSNHPSPVHSRSEVADILKRAQDSPAATSEFCSRTSSFRGNLNRMEKNGFVRGSTHHGLSGAFRGTNKYCGHLEESGGQWVNKPDRLWVEI